jgi:hypothetical protein
MKAWINLNHLMSCIKTETTFVLWFSSIYIQCKIQEFIIAEILTERNITTVYIYIGTVQTILNIYGIMKLNNFEVDTIIQQSISEVLRTETDY